MRNQLSYPLRFRRFVGWCLFLPFAGPLMWILKRILDQRVEDLPRWRALYRAVMAEGRPVMICANHLTYVDPLLIMQAFSGHFRYFTHYRTLPWNLAAREYFRNPFFGIVLWCFKCIPLDRGGSREHHADIFGTSVDILRSGEPLCVFPEGRRSRTGRFDDRKLAYGIGKIASRLPEVTVLCVYLRARGVDELAGFPRRGARFEMQVERLDVRPVDQSRESVRQITESIADRIKKLEARYFSGFSGTPG